jgi:predicted ester cyclase
MSAEENRKFIRRYLEAISGKPKTENVMRLFVAEQALIDHVLAAEAAIPLYRILPQEMVAEGDRVSVRARVSGVHQGPLMGIPPTGKPVEFTMFVTYKVQGGKIVDHWMLSDNLAVLQQIGAIPAPA